MSFEKATGLKVGQSPLLKQERKEKQTRRYNMAKVLSILKKNIAPSARVKELSSLAEKDGITGEELLKKLEKGEWNVLCG